jgi:O-antigen/teichoic acid export membrane protein
LQPTTDAGFGPSDRRKTHRGTLLSVAGGVVMALVRAMGFVLRAIFGGDAWGLYAISWALIELLAFFLVGGFADAIVIFASRQKHDPVGRNHYSSIATTIAVPFALALAFALGVHFFAEELHGLLWSEHDPLLIPLSKTLAWALPLLVLVQIPVEATRSTLQFGFAIGIVQIAFPVLSLIAALGLYYSLTPNILAIAQGTLIALCLCVPASLFAYAQHFDLRATMRAAVSLRWDREALSFAVPQSLNMMLNQGLVRLDSLMLSFFGVSANAIGVYSLVSDLTQLIRLAKMAFSGVFSPLSAKYRAEGNKRGTSEALDHFARKTSALGVFLFLLIMPLWPAFIFKPGEEWTETMHFAWFLCAGPLMSCFFGLCGNTLLMYGYSRTLLLNALGAGFLNVILNALFIPIWGLLGAALATAISNVTLSVLQIVELRRFENLGVELHYYTRTLLGAAVPVALVVYFSFDWTLSGKAWGLPFPWARMLLALSAVAVYVSAQCLLPGKKPWGRALD